MVASGFLPTAPVSGGPAGLRRSQEGQRGWAWVAYQPRPHLSLGIYLSTGAAGPQSIACQGPRAALITQGFFLPTQVPPTDL